MFKTAEKSMNVLLYLSYGSGSEKICLLNKIESAVIGQTVEIINDFRNLLERLKRFSHTIAVAILFVCSKDALSDILSVKELLEDVRIILILPDRLPETISKGHLLRPRFMTYADSDFEDVKAVLNKMLKHP
jgi:hypothetical protein